MTDHHIDRLLAAGIALMIFLAMAIAPKVATTLRCQIDRIVPPFDAFDGGLRP